MLKGDDLEIAKIDQANMDQDIAALKAHYSRRIFIPSGTDISISNAPGHIIYYRGAIPPTLLPPEQAHQGPGLVSCHYCRSLVRPGECPNCGAPT